MLQPMGSFRVHPWKPEAPDIGRLRLLNPEVDGPLRGKPGSCRFRGFCVE